MSAMVISGWDELEEIHDDILTNEDFQKQWTDIAELCVKNPTIQGLNVLARGDFYDLGNAPKYMR